jgi:undecaprenyl-diphosphatase
MPHDPSIAETARVALGGTTEYVLRPAETPVARFLPPAARAAVDRFDAAADRAFARLRGVPAADRVLYTASALGDFSLLWHLVSAGRATLRPSTTTESLRLGATLAVESVAVNVGLKSLVRRERPVWDGHEDRPHTLRTPLSSSFPSGHATSGFMAATLLAASRPRQRPLWYSVAAVVAASRVHVRIHHASDVVGGAVLGLALGALVRRVWPIREGTS